MHTIRNLDFTSPGDMFYPPFRKIEFQDEGAIVLMSTHLRHAWTALPGQAATSGTVLEFIKANHELSREDRLAVPQNGDKEILSTLWRVEIYEHWNHVFYDVSNFLQSVGPGTGHLRSSSQEVMALEYPCTSRKDTNGEEEIVKKTWNTNVLIIPTYLEPGATIGMTMPSLKGTEGTGGTRSLGAFNSSNTAEIWYVRAGVEMSFHVESSGGEKKQGTAAVLVYGILCTDEH